MYLQLNLLQNRKEKNNVENRVTADWGYMYIPFCIMYYIFPLADSPSLAYPHPTILSLARKSYFLKKKGIKSEFLCLYYILN